MRRSGASCAPGPMAASSSTTAASPRSAIMTPLQQAARRSRSAGCTRRRVAIFPGLIDLHAHVPQYPAVARGTGELLPWLRESHFPAGTRVHRAARPPRSGRVFLASWRGTARRPRCSTPRFTRTAPMPLSTPRRQSGLRIIMGKMMMDVGSYGQLQPTKIVSDLAARNRAALQAVARRGGGPDRIRGQPALCRRVHAKS